MLVQPQQAATVCELDLVRHAIGSSKRAQTVDPNQPPEDSHEPLNLTLDLEHAHVSSPMSVSVMTRIPGSSSPARMYSSTSATAPFSSAVPTRPFIRSGWFN